MKLSFGLESLLFVLLFMAKMGRVFFLFLHYFSRFLPVPRLISGVSASAWSRVLVSRR